MHPLPPARPNPPRQPRGDHLRSPGRRLGRAAGELDLPQGRSTLGARLSQRAGAALPRRALNRSPAQIACGDAVVDQPLQEPERCGSPFLFDGASPDGDQTPAATRITLRPHDPGTGEEIDKREVLKGYEYSSGALRCPLSSYRQEAPGRLWPPRSLIRETSAGQLARSGCVSWTR